MSQPLRLDATLIPAIEALYRLEPSDEAWLQGFNDALRPGFGNACVGIETRIERRDRQSHGQRGSQSHGQRGRDRDRSQRRDRGQSSLGDRGQSSLGDHSQSSLGDHSQSSVWSDARGVRDPSRNGSHDGPGGGQVRGLRISAARDVPAGLIETLQRLILDRAPDDHEPLGAQCFVATDWPFWRERRSAFERWGIADIVALATNDAGGPSCGTHIFLNRVANLDPATRTAMTRIGVHMASAFRVRRRLQGAGLLEGAAAVLDPDGTVRHAEGPASTREAREALGRAAAAIDRARGPLRHTDSHEAVAIWRPVVRGDWTLVDCVESDGKRYLVARENAPRVKPIPELSLRETQVVVLAQLGHHNKLIAYELGIADSTVRVLFARAATKLGVSSRAEVLRATRALLAPKLRARRVD